MNRSKRRLLLVATSFCVLTGTIAAHAETVAFEANAQGQVRRSTGCPEGAFLCGEAVTSLGPADYRFFLTGFEFVSDQCGGYTATTTFTRSDGSTLTLNESGTVCGPGKSFFATGGKSYGNPVDGTGEWIVADATGTFSGFTGGGTDQIHSAGAHFSVIYAGTLEN